MVLGTVKFYRQHFLIAERKSSAKQASWWAAEGVGEGPGDKFNTCRKHFMNASLPTGLIKWRFRQWNFRSFLINKILLPSFNTPLPPKSLVISGPVWQFERFFAIISQVLDANTCNKIPENPWKLCFLQQLIETLLITRTGLNQTKEASRKHILDANL